MKILFIIITLHHNVLILVDKQIQYEYMCLNMPMIVNRNLLRNFLDHMIIYIMGLSNL